MASTRRAVIDVGTNSVKLLVADVAGHHVSPVWEDSEQTRLGRGFYEAYKLQPEAIAKTAEAVAKFANKACERNAASIRVIATSAARDAKNPRDLISAIEQACGLKVEIISGEQEADWAFQGVTTDASLTEKPILILDIGGGSTEFILGCGGQKHFCRSFPLGTVRLLEKFPHQDPPTNEELLRCKNWLRDFLNREVSPELEPALRHEAEKASGDKSVRFVGTGGTVNILARMELKLDAFDRGRIEAVRLTLEQIRTHMKCLWNLPLAERKKITGLPEKRADVILPGAVICEAVMDEFDFSELRVSTRGLRFAAVMAAV